jgi:peptide/nickel transport system permease protein
VIRVALLRLFHMGLVLLGIVFLSFLMMDFAPGNFLSQMAMNPQISPRVIEALKRQYGLGLPFFSQFVRWIVALLHGDLGYSFSYHVPVSDLIAQRVPMTLLLTGSSVLLSWGAALPLAVVGARHAGSWWDRSLLSFSYLSISVPSFFLALLGLLLAEKTGWFPIGGAQSAGPMSGEGTRILDLLHHLILPAMTLALGSFGVLYRLMRSSVLEVLAQPFMIAARSRGLLESLLFWRYLFRNSVNPLVTIFGMELGGLLSGAAFTEMIFGWPGVGRLMLHAVMTRDLYLVMGGLLMGAILLLLGNLISDLLLYFLDPRVRENQ